MSKPTAFVTVTMIRAKVRTVCLHYSLPTTGTPADLIFRPGNYLPGKKVIEYCLWVGAGQEKLEFRVAEYSLFLKPIEISEKTV